MCTRTKKKMQTYVLELPNDIEHNWRPKMQIHEQTCKIKLNKRGQQHITSGRKTNMPQKIKNKNKKSKINMYQCIQAA